MNAVMITGATGGLGKAFAFNQIKCENICLVLTGRSLEKLNKLKTELSSLNSAAIIFVYPCDLTSSCEREKMYSAIATEGLKIQRLINVAGVDTQMPFKEYSEEKLLFQIKVNYEATLSITRFALLNRSDVLEILTVSSMCGLTPMPYFAVYSSSKAALINFFDSIRYEYRKEKVFITTLMPGSVPTRPDIVEDIKKQGLTGRLSQKSTDFIVNAALKGLSKHKKHVIPGFYNKLVSFLSRITPMSLQCKIIAKKFSIKRKDAF